MLNNLWDLDNYSWDDMDVPPIKVYCCPDAIDFDN